jgi:hypothetical protein
MAITYAEDSAVFDGTVNIEEAETLLEWVQQQPAGSVDLVGCTHLHAANLQVLMAAQLRVAAWPRDENLKTWLEAALGT